MGRYLLEGDSSWMRTCSGCGGAWTCKAPERSDVDPGWTCERCADNAALVEHARTERQMLALLYHRIKALGVHDATDAMTDAVTTVEGWMDAVPDTYEQPHPGAALSERVKRLDEALDGIRKAYNSWTPEMGTRASWNAISYWLDKVDH